METIEIEVLLNEGKSWTEVAHILGCHPQTVAYHARKIKQGKVVRKQKPSKSSKEYNWEEIQTFYDEGNGYVKCKNKFKFSGNTWNAAIREQRIKLRTKKEIFSLNFSRKHELCSHNIKLGLIKYGFKKNECEKCLLTQWNGLTIPIELHHIDGDRTNNKLDNLQILCPNCHAQTSNYGIRNRPELKEVIQENKHCHCGNKICSQSKTGRCRECFNKERKDRKKPISKEDLTNLIKVKPVSQIRKELGVASDATIRKWCDDYDIDHLTISPFSHVNRKKIVKQQRIHTSKYKNVYFQSKRNKWAAEIKNREKQAILFQRFDTELEAAQLVANFYNSKELILR